MFKIYVNLAIMVPEYVLDRYEDSPSTKRTG